jgi:hypothetical protein
MSPPLGIDGNGISPEVDCPNSQWRLDLLFLTGTRGSLKFLPDIRSSKALNQ